jgi:3-hydroxyanthranilate 3,4-dioxygenase
MILEYMQDGKRQAQVVREGELLLVPALTPHSPHRSPDTRGLVVEIKRTLEQTESLRWFCERCHALLHDVTMHVADDALFGRRPPYSLRPWGVKPARRAGGSAYGLHSA